MFHTLTISWLENGKKINDNNKHKFHLINSVNIFMITKVKDYVEITIMSYTQIITRIANVA